MFGQGRQEPNPKGFPIIGSRLGIGRAIRLNVSGHARDQGRTVAFQSLQSGLCPRGPFRFEVPLCLRQRDILGADRACVLCGSARSQSRKSCTCQSCSPMHRCPSDTRCPHTKGVTIPIGFHKGAVPASYHNCNISTAGRVRTLNRTLSFYVLKQRFNKFPAATSLAAPTVFKHFGQFVPDPGTHKDKASEIQNGRSPNACGRQLIGTTVEFNGVFQGFDPDINPFGHGHIDPDPERVATGGIIARPVQIALH